MKIRTPGWHEICCSLKDLFKENLFKLAVFGAVFLLGAILGIRGGMRAAGTADIADGNFLILMYISGRLSVFSYAFLTVICGLLAYAAICACSGNKWTYWLALIPLFYVVFRTAHCTVMLISVFRLAALPFVIVCFVPLKTLVLFMYLTAWLMCAPTPSVLYCRGYNARAALFNGQNAVFIPLAVAAFAVVEGILTFILTFGIVI